jgi:hypothetical protein
MSGESLEAGLSDSTCRSICDLLRVSEIDHDNPKFRRIKET